MQNMAKKFESARISSNAISNIYIIMYSSFVWYY